MNQIIKDVIYGKGTNAQVKFLAKIGGMNEEEQEIFMYFHQGKTDAYIQDEMGLSRKAYERIEESVRAKLTIALFTCINKTYDLYEEDL